MSGGSSGNSSLLNTGIQAGGSLLSSYMAGKASDRAADQQIQGLREGQAISQGAVSQARNDILGTGTPGLEDLITGFQGAISVLENPGEAEQRARALSGALGPQAQQEAINNFTESPGQQFLRDQQEQALLRNSAAIGGLGGGRVRTALQDQAFGRAATNQQQNLQNLFQTSIPEQNRAANIANILSSGGGQIAGFRSGLGTNLANASLGGAAQQIPLSEGAGAARAAGTLGVNTAMQQGVGGVSRAFGRNNPNGQGQSITITLGDLLNGQN